MNRIFVDIFSTFQFICVLKILRWHHVTNTSRQELLPSQISDSKLTFHGLPGSNSGTKSVKLVVEAGEPQSLLSGRSLTDSGHPPSRLETFDHVLE